MAFDLARAADGAWQVVGTRTQAPSGLGYALENRAIISRMLPDAFHALRIHALSPFFHQLRQIVSASAPSNSGAPHIVVLTPGPYAETYFEHAYLARQLGFSLVEGGDLAVRDGRVYLKTVSGLRAVHAILRRLDDDYCDPLELRADSKLGVPGLLQAWRAGNVTVVNAFGMGVIESPALLAFLPPICQRLFGETLETPAIATWWCGETAALADARRRLAEGVIKPAFADSSMEPVFLSDLDADARREWAERLGTTPDAYVVEEFLPLSHAPVWHDAQLESRALMLRVFLVADGRGDYRLMPEGCRESPARSVTSSRGSAAAAARTRGCCPTLRWRRRRQWSRRGRPAASTTRIRRRAAQRSTSSGWVDRERSENAARLLRSVLGRLTDTGKSRPDYPACAVRTSRPARQARARQRRARDCGRADCRLTDSHGHSSLGFNVKQTVRVASAVRDRLSTNNWRVLNRLLQRTRGLAGARPGRRAQSDRRGAALPGGDRWARDGPHDPGRRLAVPQPWPSPRTLHFVSSTLRDVARAGGGRIGLLEWLLELSDSLLTYRVRHMQQPEWESVVDLTVVESATRDRPGSS